MKNSWSCRLLAMLLALMLALPGLGLAEDDVIIAEDVDEVVSESVEWSLGEDAEQAVPEQPVIATAEQGAENAAAQNLAEPPAGDVAAQDNPEQPAGDVASQDNPEQPAGDAASQDNPEQPAGDVAAQDLAEEQPAGDVAAQDLTEQSAEDAAMLDLAEQPAGAIAAQDLAEEQLAGDTVAQSAGDATAQPVAQPAADAAQATAQPAEAQVLTSAPITGNTSLTLSVGDSMQLVMAVPIKSFKSSKAQVAVVSETGLIGAVGEGKTTITATVSKKKKFKIKVTVNNPNKPAAVTIDLSQGSEFFVGLGPTQLNVLMEPAAAQTSLKWKSSNKKVAVVSPTGVLTPLRAGRTKITVTTANKKKYTANIRIYRNVIDNISPKPTRAQVKSIGKAWAIQMKSLERTARGKYIATFYILDGLGRARWINNFNVQIYLDGKLLAQKSIGKLKVYCDKGDYNTFKVTFSGKEVSWQDLLLLPQYSPESVVYTLSSEPSLYYNHKMLIGFMQDRQNVFTELPAGVQNEMAMVNCMLELINQLRAVARLSPYTMDEELTRAACVRAGELAVKYSGTRPDGSPAATVSMKSPSELRAQVKVNTDDLGDTKAVFDGLVGSKGSLSKLLDKSGRNIGICAYKVYDAKKNVTSVYWTLEFAQW
ncbi:MAG: Ig-like domain-containing protein [Clostridia bacterium]|nr:Ig-like domain-containing protein [Clostridia bacterium]